jgi:hypothetical protein
MSSLTSSLSGSPYEVSNPLDSPEISTMPPTNRSVGRNVHIYDEKDRNTALGGLILSNGITNANFYFMVRIIIICNGHFDLKDENNSLIERNDHPLQPGKYYIAATGRLLYPLSWLCG